MYRLTKGAENDPLLRQFFTISGGNGDGVKNGIHRDFTAFAYRYAKLFKRSLNFFAEKGVCPGLLDRPRLRGAGLIAIPARRRGIVAVILIIQFLVVRLQPVRLRHVDPRSVRIQAKLQHPLRFITFGRNGAHHLFVDPFRQLVCLQLGKETLFIIQGAAGPGFDIVSCFSITRHSTAYTPKLSPQPHSFWAFGL